MIDWDGLVRREGSAVWRTIYRLVRNQADADECFQETFVDALRLSQRQEVTNWPALLKRLALARAVDRMRQRLRRKRREDAVDVETVVSIVPGPCEHAQAVELAGQLRWGLSQLTARQAELFCLHELERWTYQDIAQEYSMTTSAVGVLLHRARAKLKRLFLETFVSRCDGANDERSGRSGT